jgi:hypothetical protein
MAMAAAYSRGQQSPVVVVPSGKGRGFNRAEFLSRRRSRPCIVAEVLAGERASFAQFVKREIARMLSLGFGILVRG